MDRVSDAFRAREFPRSRALDGEPASQETFGMILKALGCRKIVVSSARNGCEGRPNDARRAPGEGALAGHALGVSAAIVDDARV